MEYTLKGWVHVPEGTSCRKIREEGERIERILGVPLGDVFSWCLFSGADRRIMVSFKTEEKEKTSLVLENRIFAESADFGLLEYCEGGFHAGTYHLDPCMLWERWDIKRAWEYEAKSPGRSVSLSKDACLAVLAVVQENKGCFKESVYEEIMSALS